MIKRFCDLCGKDTDSFNCTLNFVTEQESYTETESYDICHDCYSSIIEQAHALSHVTCKHVDYKQVTGKEGGQV